MNNEAKERLEALSKVRRSRDLECPEEAWEEPYDKALEVVKDCIEVGNMDDLSWCSEDDLQIVYPHLDKASIVELRIYVQAYVRFEGSDDEYMRHFMIK